MPYFLFCFFLNWFFFWFLGRALEVVETTYNQTVCVSAHMTLFAAGFFVQPNSMDFDFILKEMDFFDNETIYSTILITCIAYLLFLIVARFVDYTDVQEKIILILIRLFFFFFNSEFFRYRVNIRMDRFYFLKNDYFVWKKLIKMEKRTGRFLKRCHLKIRFFVFCKVQNE